MKAIIFAPIILLLLPIVLPIVAVMYLSYGESNEIPNKQGGIQAFAYSDKLSLRILHFAVAPIYLAMSLVLSAFFNLLTFALGTDYY